MISNMIRLRFNLFPPHRQDTSLAGGSFQIIDIPDQIAGIGAGVGMTRPGYWTTIVIPESARRISGT